MKITENADEAPKKRSKLEAFEHLKKSVEESAPFFTDIGDNDKEVLLKHLDEKYGPV